MIETAIPRIEVLEQTEVYGKFVVEPLERGYGVTLGNSLRRVLLSSIPGAAVQSIKIDGVLHEFSTIPGVKEDTTELILNLKNLFVKVHDDGQHNADTPREPRVIRVDVKGAGTVTGADIQCPSDVEVVNPEVYLATLSDDSAHLSMELTVDEGKGYVLPDKQDKTKQVIGVIPIGAAYTPVRKVSFNVEATRVGFKTDFERLTLEVWTNGTIPPGIALSQPRSSSSSSSIALSSSPTARRTIGAGRRPGVPAGRRRRAGCPYRGADFSVRTYNCLRRPTYSRLATPADLRRRAHADPQLRQEVADRGA